MTDPKVTKEALGWGVGGLSAVVLGVLLKAMDQSIGAPVAALGALVLVVCLATIAYELIRSD